MKTSLNNETRKIYFNCENLKIKKNKETSNEYLHTFSYGMETNYDVYSFYFKITLEIFPLLTRLC
jgi:hypothetical protein